MNPSLRWSLKIEPDKKYTTVVETSFHISKAILDKNSSEEEFVSVILEDGNNVYILCNLNRCLNQQTDLDLKFLVGDRITLYTLGEGIVYLTGYLASHKEESEGEEPIIRNPKKLNLPEQAKAKDRSGVKKKLRVGGPSLKADLGKIKLK